MQLVVDVGNTETVIGLASSVRELAGHWRISSGVSRTADETTALIRAFLSDEGLSASNIERGVVGSVVPAANRVWTKTLGRIVTGDVFAISPQSELPIELDVEEPMSVGADRIANTLAGRELYHRDTIVVDLGTATTFDCITSEGVFKGGVISPGLLTGIDWLASRTAKLPRVELTPPRAVIGRRTETCIQSGIFYQAVDSIDGMVQRLREEWSRPEAYVVATGGFSNTIGPHLATIDKIEPFLTLYGLAMAGDYLGG